MTAPLVEVLRRQGRICASLGSPMYGELLELIAADVESGGVFAEVLDGHQDDPIGSAIALRLVGGLHRLVFDAAAPELNRWYPSVGGAWDGAAAWGDITGAAATHRQRLRAALGSVPQTNEVGRSAALIGGLLRIVDQSPMPVRLFEIGASAGLNLRADQYLYRYADGQWGPAGSPVVIEDAWEGMRPPEVPLRIVERHGFDIAPVDAMSDDGRRTLLSYVWPDMPARLDRLRGAIDIARRVPAGLDRMSAADAVAGLRLVRGTVTVLWHSITWQYLSANEQDTVTARAAELGARADAATPFVWLSLEPIRRNPDARHEFLVRARCWPEGTDEILGSCSPHGPPVHWD
ncbi:DUF2332 domain-containing protein [Mycolicibacterium komossense]|uniref:DUF2332 family protein n=1 Tax=Mycolicibacterium komossense TaxID=1779 RepID=A0ABT3CDB8_9MYCO|nr:DUF2332 family protein [Mycolicibacterium komossense]MCV7227467.1 DUF2332 family protein [Mycolicibacterium komossense]